MWKTYPVFSSLPGFTNFQFYSLFSWRHFNAILHKVTILIFSLRKKLRKDIFFPVFTKCNRNTKLSWDISRRASPWLPSSPKQLYFYRSFKITEILTEILVSKIIPGRRKSPSGFYFPFFQIPALLRISNSCFQQVSPYFYPWSTFHLY